MAMRENRITVNADGTYKCSCAGFNNAVDGRQLYTKEPGFSKYPIKDPYGGSEPRTVIKCECCGVRFFEPEPGQTKIEEYLCGQCTRFASIDCDLRHWYKPKQHLMSCCDLFYSKQSAREDEHVVEWHNRPPEIKLNSKGDYECTLCGNTTGNHQEEPPFTPYKPSSERYAAGKRIYLGFSHTEHVVCSDCGGIIAAPAELMVRARREARRWYLAAGLHRQIRDMLRKPFRRLARFIEQTRRPAAVRDELPNFRKVDAGDIALITMVQLIPLYKRHRKTIKYGGR
jgi:ribosomal protein S27E